MQLNTPLCLLPVSFVESELFILFILIRDLEKKFNAGKTKYEFLFFGIYKLAFMIKSKT